MTNIYNSSPKLPGVTRVYITASDLLPSNLMALAEAGLTALAPANMEIPLLKEGELTIETKEKEGEPYEEAKLEFSTTMDIKPSCRVSYTAVLASGDVYIIGTKEDHPVTTRTVKSGTPDGDPSVITYEVNHSALIAAIPALV